MGRNREGEARRWHGNSTLSLLHSQREVVNNGVLDLELLQRLWEMWWLDALEQKNKATPGATSGLSPDDLTRPSANSSVSLEGLKRARSQILPLVMQSFKGPRQ